MFLLLTSASSYIQLSHGLLKFFIDYWIRRFTDGFRQRHGDILDGPLQSDVRHVGQSQTYPAFKKEFSYRSCSFVCISHQTTRKQMQSLYLYRPLAGVAEMIIAAAA